MGVEMRREKSDQDFLELRKREDRPKIIAD
jgi:hypothetical protein